MRYLAAVIAFGFFFAPTVRGDVVMNVVASPGPNFFTSPSWAGYTANALNSLENNLGAIGDRNLDPTAYEIFSDGSIITPNELIVSSFPSWRGVADPTSPFSNETGNRIHFGLHIVGDGLMRFRLQDLSYEVSSTEGNLYGFDGDFSGTTYSASRFGIDYGLDMVKGGVDDTIINSGPATQIVDEIVYVGIGTARDASGFAGPTNQERIDQLLAQMQSEGAFDITGGYSLTDSTGTSILAMGSTTISVVPEPSGVFALTVIATVAGTRRRRRRVLR